jgi:hypothetical protein
MPASSRYAGGGVHAFMHDAGHASRAPENQPGLFSESFEEEAGDGLRVIQRATVFDVHPIILTYLETA